MTERSSASTIWYSPGQKSMSTPSALRNTSFSGRVGCTAAKNKATLFGITGENLHQAGWARLVADMSDTRHADTCYQSTDSA